MKNKSSNARRSKQSEKDYFANIRSGFKSEDKKEENEKEKKKGLFEGIKSLFKK